MSVKHCRNFTCILALGLNNILADSISTFLNYNPVESMGHKERLYKEKAGIIKTSVDFYAMPLQNL